MLLPSDQQVVGMNKWQCWALDVVGKVCVFKAQRVDLPNREKVAFFQVRMAEMQIATEKLHLLFFFFLLKVQFLFHLCILRLKWYC